MRQTLRAWKLYWIDHIALCSLVFLAPVSVFFNCIAHYYFQEHHLQLFVAYPAIVIGVITGLFAATVIFLQAFTEIFANNTFSEVIRNHYGESHLSWAEAMRPRYGFFAQPGWLHHRHCGDWLHGGQCPDQTWHWHPNSCGRRYPDGSTDASRGNIPVPPIIPQNVVPPVRPQAKPHIRPRNVPPPGDIPPQDATGGGSGAG